jgi:hypothetical protein
MSHYPVGATRVLDNMTRILYLFNMADQPTHERKSRSDVAQEQAAVRDVVPAMVVLLMLQGSLILLDPHGEVTVWYLLWSFSPLAPALWLIWAQLRGLGRADEYQRVIQLESMAIGFGSVILLSLIGGLLDAAKLGDPRTSLQVTFTGGVLIWATALIIKISRVQ